MLTHNDAGSVVPSFLARPSVKSIMTAWAASVAVLSLVAAGVIEGPRLLASPSAEVIAVPPPVVSVTVPMQRSLATRVQVLGQFSAVQNVELRPQVGGALTQIGFKDGTLSRRAIFSSRSIRRLTRSSSAKRLRSSRLRILGSI
jgi:hypothetical protein